MESDDESSEAKETWNKKQAIRKNRNNEDCRGCIKCPFIDKSIQL